MTYNVNMKKLIFPLILCSFTSFAKPAVVGTMDETIFKKVIKDVTGLYSKELSMLNKEIKMEINWNSKTPNASVGLHKNIISMSFHGEFPRKFKLTSDAYAITVCHELGHLLGGMPKVMPTQKYSAEAQSDYFATKECFKRYMDAVPNDNVDTSILSKEQKSLCDKSENKVQCLRGLVAISIDGNAYEGDKSINHYSHEEVEITNYNDYPNAQCRIDTMRAGLLCEEDECLTGKGSRPACWYKEDLSIKEIEYDGNYEYQEALVIGKTGTVTKTSSGCHVDVDDISYFTASYINPMSEDHLWNKGFHVIGPCPIKQDSNFSGTITNFKGKFYYNLKHGDK